MPEFPTTSPYKDADLEYKPWVKVVAWSAIGVGCMALAYYAFYSLGYESGKRDAAAMAESNLAAVLRLAESAGMPGKDAAAEPSKDESAEEDEAALLELAKQKDKVFSAIADPAQRREAQGRLLSLLMERGLLVHTDGLLEDVIPPSRPQNSVWAQRMLRTARWQTQQGRWEKARTYLQELQNAAPVVETAVVLRAWADLAQEAGLDAVELQRELNELLAKATEQGNAELAMEMSVSLGHLCRSLGDEAAALEHYRSAVDALAQAEPQTDEAALLYGVALFEVGEKQKATDYLQRGLARCSGRRELVEFRAMALRHLATLSLQSGRAMDALHYLYRAEGEAAGVISPNSVLWSCLADQIAWTLYTMREYDDALAYFLESQRSAGDADYLKAQPMEGAALCYMALGRAEEATQAARRCAHLRAEVLPEDKVRLGLVYLLQGQAHDQAGQLQDAAEQYGRAADLLPAEMAEHSVALENRAHALTQAEDWGAAAAAWEQLLANLPADATERVENARRNLDTCRQKRPESTSNESRAESHSHRN